ncbi:hypothetical protein SAMN05216349_10663 [Oribacterium sp. KHPX15]|uniref:DUF5688 family protein n=1 Tax=Oribacterium sp. KHPX15 TaxID=1855342 RepID=UPI00089CEF10|nr:DUF5688 family protein [Oribacterium sp. KHPX15]SEA18518.1 hypothetical protein SAMN05216349_10663 [Oribacterium sp. KHPX15]
MDYEQFKESFERDIKGLMEDRGLNVKINSTHMEKLNESYDAISITPEGSQIGVNANLNHIFKAIERGVNYEEVAAKAADSIAANLQNTPDINIDNLMNYDHMKSKLTMEVVSAERNADMLRNVPHEQMEDMAVVYRLVLSESTDGRSSILVTNNLMNQFGITHDQLREDAMKNAPEIRPSEIKGMCEVMNELMGHDLMPELSPQDEQMFVASVPDKVHGAGVIAYPNFFEEAAEKLGGDYYVLPSSIHEVLLVRDNGQMTSKELEAMVRDVNATQVAPEEQLTDHVYHYDSKDHVFEMADKFEERKAEREELSSEKASVLDDLKAKKEEIAKSAPENHEKPVVNKSKGGEAL